ncbi:helix-turn-helix domain-containing protein [Treponema primitia]|uniref:helix-turn-helix domain-containing protein n=1 Tax=Treponema primitia TaxID=88058 RepID=UPI0002555086|nr:helix-turn-helix transcriptional regulator [Treponema primitia]
MADDIFEAEIRATLGKNLKRFRAKQKLSQLQLAVKAGLTHNFINDLENGKKWLSPQTLVKLSKALKLEPYQFLMPEGTIPDQAATALAERLDDMADAYVTMVKDLKGRYLQDSTGED